MMPVRFIGLLSIKNFQQYHKAAANNGSYAHYNVCT